MAWRRVCCVFLCLTAVSVVAIWPMPPEVSAAHESETVTAVVVKSWGLCPPGSALVWDELNTNWPNYGTTPIVVDYSHPVLCPGPVTYADLVASGADVVILSDPAGGMEQYSDEEIEAVMDYAEDGHNVIGTYLVLQYPPIDNRGLAPAFGLQATLNYTATALITTTFELLEPANPLFNGMAGSYTSAGFAFSQVPEDNAWHAEDLAGARIVALTPDSAGAVLVYDGPGYHAIFATHMPEYYGSVEDERFLYNAIAYPSARTFVYLPLVTRQ